MTRIQSTRRISTSTLESCTTQIASWFSFYPTLTSKKSNEQAGAEHLIHLSYVKADRIIVCLSNQLSVLFISAIVFRIGNQGYLESFEPNFLKTGMDHVFPPVRVPCLLIRFGSIGGFEIVEFMGFET